MKPLYPLCCELNAHSYLAEQVKSDQIGKPAALLKGAVAIAMQQSGERDGNRIAVDVEKKLGRIAAHVRSRVEAGNAYGALHYLNQHLFEELKFKVVNHLDHRTGSLPLVLDNRIGMPVILALIYKLVADRIGIPCYGICLRNHFFIAVKTNTGTLFINPSGGGKTHLEEEVLQWTEAYNKDNVDKAEDRRRWPVYLCHAEWLNSIISSIGATYRASENYIEVGAMIEMQMLLWPSRHFFERDLGLTLYNAKHFQDASRWLGKYLRRNPTDTGKSTLRQILSKCRTKHSSPFL